MTKSFIWKENSNKEIFQFSNTHVFNLFAMEKKGKKKCGFSLHHLLKKKKKLNRRWNFSKKEIIKVVLFPNAPLSLL
jgi:hypothetical protein